jgi:hypothetical protein
MTILIPVDTWQINETLRCMLEGGGSILGGFMEIFIDLILPSALWS